MAKGNQFILGFDLEAAISTLHTRALEAGAVPEGDWRAEDPWNTANAHMHGKDGRSCTKTKCRVGGLCYALKELLFYKRGQAGAAPFIAAADDTETMCKAMFKAGGRYIKTLERLRNDSQTLHQQEAEHHHEILCVRPAHILKLMIELQRSLVNFEDELRGLLWSFQLQQSSHAKGGHLLLSAVRQHLAWGGLEDEEIAELVPDGLGTIGDSHLKRVDHSVRKEPNARCVVPAELDGKLKKKKRVRTKKPKAEATTTQKKGKLKKEKRIRTKKPKAEATTTHRSSK
jgi:hypothetical protein